MEADKDDVIGKQHEGCEMVGNSALAECIITKIANVHDLRMFHDKFVHGDGGDPEQSARDEHGDDSWDPA